MKKKKLLLDRDKYIKSIIPIIESNAIYDKPTGGGITSLEIEVKRNSIIIEPNRPVIQGKCLKYNGKNRRSLVIRGVFEGITVDDIVKYLQSKVKFKKIITTPESYSKVVDAFKQLDMMEIMYNEYFMLIDECEKTIQDMDYRKNIILPMNDFFRFKSKAFVSATPIIPSDPRFKAHKFKYIEIKYRKPIKQKVEVITTNNIILSLKAYVDINKDDRYFIFVNSTKMMSNIMDFLSIQKESLIFCSDESKGKLALNGIKGNVFTSMINSADFKKYNFFTSRFFSAVDIEDVSNPNIIVLTDCYLAEYTKIDPNTELIQIIGRFRRPENGTIERRLTHITNVNPLLECADEVQIVKDFAEFEKIYRMLKHFENVSSTYVAKEVIRELTDNSEFSKYVNKDGSKNYYMLDNLIFQNKINGHYQSVDNLSSAYNLTKYFHLNHTNQSFITDDKSILLQAGVNDLKPALELLMPIFKRLYVAGLDNPDVMLELKLIEKEHPTAYKSFISVGFDKANSLGFSYKEVVREAKRIKSIGKYKHFGFMGFIKENFKVNACITNEFIKSTLKNGIQKFNLSFEANKKLLENYFELSDYKYLGLENGRKVYGYTILKKKL